MAPPHKKKKHDPLDTGILLEVGTNELEVLRFTLNGLPFGINVSKLREIILTPEYRPMAGAHPAYDGVFLLRKRTIPLFSLRTFMGMPPYTAAELANARSSLVLVTEFNANVSAYRVDGVDRIWRVTSEQVEPPPSFANGDKVPITAMITIEGKPMPMLDFETIYNTITGNGMIISAERPHNAGARARKHVTVVEDSPTIRRLIVESIHGSGYVPTTFENGKLAWEWLQGLAKQGPKEVAAHVDIVITDIEMPQMDGLTLCRQIRENPTLKPLPVILFSSLVTEANRIKGDTVGATAQISKPQLGQAVELMDQILGIKG